MKSMMVLAVLMGVAALLWYTVPGVDEESPKARLIATNYVVYRNHAFIYVFKERPESGDIPDASLELPAEWRPLRPWKTRIQDGCCYIYGPASSQEIEAARNLLNGSLGVGRADNGRLMSDGKTPIPAFVPEGSLVSVFMVNGDNQDEEQP